MDLYSPQVLEESNGSLTISFRQLLVCRAISRLSFERFAEFSYNKAVSLPGSSDSF